MAKNSEKKRGGTDSTRGESTLNAGRGGRGRRFSAGEGVTVAKIGHSEKKKRKERRAGGCLNPRKIKETEMPRHGNKRETKNGVGVKRSRSLNISNGGKRE